MPIPPSIYAPYTSLDDFLKFFSGLLLRSRITGWEGNQRFVDPQRPGCKEMVYIEGNEWEFRDSYAGSHLAPGAYTCWRHGDPDFPEGKPFWMMPYTGGMADQYIGDLDRAKRTFDFLKVALKSATPDFPFRGPKKFSHPDFPNMRYECRAQGNLARFEAGYEAIWERNERVFHQDFSGCLIVHKKDILLAKESGFYTFK